MGGEALLLGHDQRHEDALRTANAPVRPHSSVRQRKHYFVGEDELEKLLAKGGGWLASHPEKEQITRRYLKHRSSPYRDALERLVDAEGEETIDDYPAFYAALD